MSVRMRFAPSPTGYLHLGNARTALFNWLHARHVGGTFLLRIEDTDRDRHNEAAVQVIYDSLKWLGMDWDEDVIRQSTRFDVYPKFAQDLIDAGHAYRCNMSREELDAAKAKMKEETGQSRYDRTNRDTNLGPDCGEHVIRFKTPLDGESSFDDVIQGTVTKQQSELDDFIMIRTDGTPTYQFAVVVDDHEMSITHVCRGADHIDNTHDQLNLYKAFGWTPPAFAHAPRILGLSKRKGSPSVEHYRDELGMTREGLVNYLVRLGWSHGDEEIFSLEELVEKFDLGAVNRPNGNFDETKLTWVNQQQMHRIDVANLIEQAKPHFAAAGIELEASEWLDQVIAVTRLRASTLKELVDVSAYFFNEPGEYVAKAAKKWLKASSAEILDELADNLEAVQDWSREAVMAVYDGICARREIKMGKVAQPARVSMTGNSASPGIDDTTFLVGQERAVARMRRGAVWIRENRG